MEKVKDDLERLTPAAMAALLTSTGLGEFTPAELEARVAEGAPVNPDGSLNLTDLAAWLASKVTGPRA